MGPKAGAVGIDFEPRAYANRDDAKAYNWAAPCFERSVGIDAFGEKLAAKTQNRA